MFAFPNIFQFSQTHVSGNKEIHETALHLDFYMSDQQRRRGKRESVLPRKLNVELEDALQRNTYKKLNRYYCVTCVSSLETLAQW